MTVLDTSVVERIARDAEERRLANAAALAELHYATTVVNTVDILLSHLQAALLRGDDPRRVMALLHAAQDEGANCRLNLEARFAHTAARSATRVAQLLARVEQEVGE